MTRLFIILTLLTSACTSAPEPQKILPPPEVLQHAAPLRPFHPKTCEDVENDDAYVTQQYGILTIQNNQKADWIGTVYGK